jgi:uncharacterized membrane protein HdeD (DUF308 family)
MGKSLLWVVIGLVSIAGGILALANPFVASMAATTIAAWVFIFVGILEIVAAFGAEGALAKVGNVLLGALAVFLGISILQHPLAGMVALTTLVGILILAAGIFKMVIAFSLEDRRFFWLILLSGLISVVLAVMIFGNFPQSAAVILGLLLGIDLISNGVSLIAMGFALNKARRLV